MTKYQKIRFELLTQAYNPSGPVTQLDMFKGRNEQIDAVLDCVSERGRSAIIFGERGVGKTSLATVIFDLIQSVSDKVPYWYALATCDRTSTFSSLWSESFGEIQMATNPRRVAGFGNRSVRQALGEEEVVTLKELLGNGTLSPSSVRKAIWSQPSVWIFDEFNLVPGEQKELFADLMKGLSDKNSAATVVLVCVADDVQDVISAHESTERCTKQIQMPRMSESELRQVLERGENITGMAFEEGAADAVVGLSQGLPYFTHFLAREGSIRALAGERLRIAKDDIYGAIEDFVGNAQESLKEAYRKAVYSKSRKAIHPEVLLACALSRRDDFGLFTITAVAESLSKLRSRKTTPGVFASHMSQFSTDSARGLPLTRKGSKGSFVYRFSNPLLQPYVILRGISEGRIKYRDLAV